MRDPRERFAACAEDYDRHRPGYPPALLDWVLAETATPPGASAADLGCGTGIATRMLAARGLDVVGIDPTEAMLERARRAGGARYRRAEAEATGLPAGSQRLVTAAQSFHWFGTAALDEIDRILAPGGWCAAWWNQRPETGAFAAGYERLLHEHSSEYGRVPRPDGAVAALRRDPRVTRLREARFDHPERLDLDTLLGRARSASYVAHGVARPDAFAAALRELFEAHQSGGRVELCYRATACCWQPPTVSGA